MIEVRYRGRLGNTLFQYCLGRILATELGFALVAGPIAGFPNTRQPVAGKSHRQPQQVLTGHIAPVAQALADRSERAIILDGWFQRYEYYRPHRNAIRDWLAFDPAIAVAATDADVVVHVRRNDYVQLGWALPFSYYEAAINTLLPRSGKVCILTDDPSDPFFRNFRQWPCTLLGGTALENLLLMTRAPRLVMSQSTYSWWPAFLAPEGQQVVCPAPHFGAWSVEGGEGISEGIDLIERDRFTCLDCAEPYRPAGWERGYQKWRRFKRRTIIKANRNLGLSLREPPP